MACLVANALAIHAMLQKTVMMYFMARLYSLKACTTLCRGGEMFLVPRDAAVDEIDRVLRLADPVPLARVADHHRLDADVLQRDIKLFRLGDRHVVVVLSMHEHRRRLDVLDVADR